jgi:hypothetical protein
VGRASNRKKAQRKAGPDSRKARQGFQADAATPDQLPGGLGELVQLARSRVEREADAHSAWRGLDARVAADALIGAFADNYRCERPEDLEELERIGYPGGNALENLVDAGAVAPADILPAGLTILPALARLCLSDSVSILHRTA